MNGGTGEAINKRNKQEFFFDYKDQRIKNILEIDNKFEENKEKEKSSVESKSVTFTKNYDEHDDSQSKTGSNSASKSINTNLDRILEKNFLAQNLKMANLQQNSNLNSRQSSMSKRSRRLTTMAEIKIRKQTDGLMPDAMKLPQDMTGYLMKYSPSMWAGWQKRFFVLKDRKLKYFKSDT